MALTIKVSLVYSLIRRGPRSHYPAHPLGSPQQSSMNQKNWELEPPRSTIAPPVKKITPVPCSPTPPRRRFDRRPPRSPLPALRRRALQRVVGEYHDQMKRTTRAIVVLDSPLINRARKERRPATVAAATSTAGPSRRARKGSASSTQSSATRAARRRTLNEELRVSDEMTEDDLGAFDIELHSYTAVGPASGRTRRGFFAHGGGDGVPVFMGVEMGDDELESIGPSRLAPPPPRTERGHTIMWTASQDAAGLG